MNTITSITSEFSEVVSGKRFNVLGLANQKWTFCLPSADNKFELLVEKNSGNCYYEYQLCKTDEGALHLVIADELSSEYRLIDLNTNPADNRMVISAMPKYANSPAFPIVEILA